jgi:hypothetical protein
VFDLDIYGKNMFRYVMKDGTYQRKPNNIDDIKQEKTIPEHIIAEIIDNIKQNKMIPEHIIAEYIIATLILGVKYFIHPVRTSEPDPSQKTPIS